ncbi:hypothetical protein [Geobacter sp. SVR]|uniref:hypothetical protein n=1 Tax=Geobacter sp. SVR TaxID=2495594 RepID=UPI00143F013B|nr:hypothetical protein [Geobacter sp. SVR]BCS54735.1 hypothetical protein GSVR_30430 [Geobacter sp. SVR]GCF86457.1 hypothetical protein GSbR_30570 [Geobacter sp. SVR]
MASIADNSGVSSSQALKAAVPAITWPAPDSPAAAYGRDAGEIKASESEDIVTLTRKERQSGQQANHTNEKPTGMKNILFSYNFRGNLQIRFMDSTNSVVYQTPPLYFSRLTEIIASTHTSVSFRT